MKEEYSSDFIEFIADYISVLHGYSLTYLLIGNLLVSFFVELLVTGPKPDEGKAEMLEKSSSSLISCSTSDKAESSFTFLFPLNVSKSSSSSFRTSTTNAL